MIRPTWRLPVGGIPLTCVDVPVAGQAQTLFGLVGAGELGAAGAHGPRSPAIEPGRAFKVNPAGLPCRSACTADAHSLTCLAGK
jgi:hypothetical protein